MAAFSASDIAFEGFRITRERPLWVLGWIGLYLALQLATLAIVGALAGSAISDLQSAMSDPSNPPDPAALLAVYGRLAPAYSLILPLTLVFYAVMVCAIYRAVIRPTEPAFLGMRLGADELRVLVVTIAVFLLLGVVYLVGVIALALVAGGIGAAAGEAAGVVAALVLALGLVGVLVFFLVRLSLATVMTFAQRDFRVFESWRATQGSFWPLLGAYLLALIFALLVSLLLGIVMVALLFGGAASLGQSLTEIFSASADPTRLFSVLGPLAVVYLVVSAVASVASNIIMTSPPAAAWRSMEGPEKAFA